MKCYNCCFIVVFMLFSFPLFAEEPQLPTSAEIFQEAVDTALKIDNGHYFLFVQTIHAQRDCNDIEGIRTTVAKALPHIRKIPKSEDRYAELEALASALHKAGLEDLAEPLFEESVQTARETANPVQRVRELVTLSAFRSLKQNMAETIEPLFEEAKELAFSLEEDQRKSQAMAIIAERYLQFCGVHVWNQISHNQSDVPSVVLPRDTEKVLPYLKQALETIEAMPSADNRDRSYLHVVHIYLKMKKYSQALDTIQKMKTLRYFYDTGMSDDGVLIAFAKYLTQENRLEEHEGMVDELIRISGDYEAVFNFAERENIHSRTAKLEFAQWIIRLLCKLDRFDEAMQWGKHFPEIVGNDYGRLKRRHSGIDEVNYHIALELGKSGKNEEAVQHLERIENNYCRNEGFWQLAMIQVHTGDDQTAIENALRIDETEQAKDMFEHRGEVMRLSAIRSIARIQFEAGKRDESLQTLRLTGQFAHQGPRMEGMLRRRYEFSESGLIGVNMLAMVSDYVYPVNKEAAVFFAQEAVKQFSKEEDSLDKGNMLAQLLWLMGQVQDDELAEELLPVIESCIQKECEKETPRYFEMSLPIDILGSRKGFDLEILDMIAKNAPDYVKEKIISMKQWQQDQKNLPEPDFAKMLADARKISDLRQRCDQLRAVAARMSGVNKSQFYE